MTTQLPISRSLETDFQRKDKAKKIIRRSTLCAAGLGFIPIPLLDAVSITGIQVWMIREIAKVYNIPFKRHIVKSFIGSLIGNTGAIGLVKFIPGAGSILGGGTVSVSAATATYALGQLFMEHFNQGGTLLDFDPVKSQAYFQKLYKEEEATVQALQKENNFEEDDKAANDALKEIEAELKAQHQVDIEKIAALEKTINELTTKEEAYLVKQQADTDNLAVLVTDKNQLTTTIHQLQAQLKVDREELRHLQTSSETLRAGIAKLQQQKLEVEETIKKQKIQYLDLQREKVTQKEKHLAAQEEQKESILKLLDSNKDLQQATVTLQQQVLAGEKVKLLNRWFWLLLPLLFVLGWLGGLTYGKRSSNSVPQERVQPVGEVSDKVEESKPAPVEASPALLTNDVPSVGPDAATLGFDPDSAEGAMADHLSNPAAVYPKTFWAKKIYFAPNATQPDPSSMQQIDNIVLLTEQYPTMKMRIYSHTDEIEGKAAGINRADIIANILKEKGTKPSQILTSLIEKAQEGEGNRGVEFELLSSQKE